MIRFYYEIDKSPKSFLQKALAEDFKTFLQWILDHYPRVCTSESMNNYWRILNMHSLNETSRTLDDTIRRDVTNVSSHADTFHSEQARLTCGSVTI